MPSVHREGGFRIVIYLGDHDPPHVHVIGNRQVKISLAGVNAPDIIGQTDMTRSDLQKALRIVDANLATLLQHWRRLNG